MFLSRKNLLVIIIHQSFQLSKPFNRATSLKGDDFLLVFLKTEKEIIFLLKQPNLILDGAEKNARRKRARTKCMSNHKRHLK